MDKETADKITEIVESCWDENNPNDDSTFTERLHRKLEELSDEDKALLEKVLQFE